MGERGTENIGLAVFKDYKYIGDLTAMDTLCHTLITAEVHSCILTIDNPELYPDYIDINLFENTSPEISVDISTENPTINIDIKLTGRIIGVKAGDTLTHEMDLDLDKIADSVNKYLEDIFVSYLNKTTSEFQCDLDNFYASAKQKFVTNQDWENYDWASRYPNSRFNVKIDTNLYYNLLNSD